MNGDTCHFNQQIPVFHDGIGCPRAFIGAKSVGRKYFVEMLAGPATKPSREVLSQRFGRFASRKISQCSVFGTLCARRAARLANVMFSALYVPVYVFLREIQGIHTKKAPTVETHNQERPRARVPGIMIRDSFICS